MLVNARPCPARPLPPPLYTCTATQNRSRPSATFRASPTPRDMPNPPQNRTTRCVQALLFLLERGRATTQEVARHVGGSPRQTREDLKLLMRVAPVESIGERERRVWVTKPGVAVRGLALLDRISLELGRSMGGFLRGTLIADGLEDFAPLDGVPARFAPHIDRKFRLRSEPSRSYADCTDTLDVVVDALLRELELDLQYESRHGPRDLSGLQPLSLVLYRRAVYLLARSPARDGVLRLPVERIVEATRGEAFTYPDDWDPDAELRPWFGIHSGERPERITLRFSAKVRHLVRARTWHPTQQLDDTSDGGVTLRMWSGGTELVRFCLEWGEHCFVVEPPWLRDAVVRELRGALAQYHPAPLLDTAEAPPDAEGTR